MAVKHQLYWHDGNSTLTTAENLTPPRRVRSGTEEVSALVGGKLDADGTSKGARTVGDTVSEGAGGQR